MPKGIRRRIGEHYKQADENPVELELIRIFEHHGLRYTRPDREPCEPTTLDFRLTDLNLHIEAKAWSSERLHRQLRNSGKEQDGIIVVIGLEGAKKLGRILDLIAQRR